MTAVLTFNAMRKSYLIFFVILDFIKVWQLAQHPSLKFKEHPQMLIQHMGKFSSHTESISSICNLKTHYTVDNGLKTREFHT